MQEQLCCFIKIHGAAIINDTRRCREMLKELAPEYHRETNLLIIALDQKIVSELVQNNTVIPLPILLDRLALRLHENVGVQKDFARWAVESWVLALGVNQRHEHQRTLPNKSLLVEDDAVGIKGNNQVGMLENMVLGEHCVRIHLELDRFNSDGWFTVGKIRCKLPGMRFNSLGWLSEALPNKSR